MPFVREIHMHLLGEFCAKLFYNLGSLSPHFLSICGIPKNFECFSTTYSEKQMKVYETQRDSNPLEVFTFFFFLLYSTVGRSRVGAFSSWRVLVSDFSVVTANSPEKAIRWCGLGAFCFLSFCPIL